ncbi:MAG TPA: flagellar hook capping FlgD N-terminal domain-containing protein [Candidatus Binatia bacterium]|nr:flagellar hook capping FlgD N-terminal domain-containing protein [Candidatus Binatia bacterium]
MSTAAVPSSLLNAFGPGTSTSSTSATSQPINQQQFLTLFVAQLQNQDPLSPMDPDQLTAELAQFSQLEQLTNINTAMGGLTTTSQQSVDVGLLSLVGKQVQYDGSTITLTNGKAPAVSYTLAQGASDVRATITDSSGTVVRTIDLGGQGAGTHTFQFDGTDGQGVTLADGSYTVALTATGPGGGTPSPVSLVNSGTIDGVDLTSTPPVLLVGGQRITLDQVHGVDSAAAGS